MRRPGALLVAMVLVLSALGVVNAATAAAVTICNTVSDVRDSRGAAVGYETLDGNSVDCDFRLSESYNPAVKQLQWALNHCYGPNATVQGAVRGVFGADLGTDGHYGPRTQSAVKAVQTRLNSSGAGLTVDGYAGPRTRSKMRHASSSDFGDYCATVATVPPQIITPEPPPTPPTRYDRRICEIGANGAPTECSTDGILSHPGGWVLIVMKDCGLTGTRAQLVDQQGNLMRTLDHEAKYIEMPNPDDPDNPYRFAECATDEFTIVGLVYGDYYHLKASGYEGLPGGPGPTASQQRLCNFVTNPTTGESC